MAKDALEQARELDAKLLTIVEAARAIGKTERALLLWARAGLLRTARIAGRLVTTRQALEQAAASVRPQGRPKNQG